MSTVYQYFDKDTFVPEKNYFSTERVECKRKQTELEEQLESKADMWRNIGFSCIGWGCLFGLIFIITFGILSNFNYLWCFGAVFGVFLFVGGIVFANAACWPKEQEYLEQYRSYRFNHEEELWAEATAELRHYNEEQKKIAEAWRAEHPLEEKIRACVKDPMSSVDIANLARYYAECYLNGDTSHIGKQGPKGDCPKCPFEGE